MQNNRIIVKDFIKNTFAVSTESGDKLFNELKKSLEKGETVELDFNGIIVLITAFLNSSIGSLYNNMFPDDYIDTHVKYTNVSVPDKKYIDLVISNAKKYYKNKDRFDGSIDDALNG